MEDKIKALAFLNTLRLLIEENKNIDTINCIVQTDIYSSVDLLNREIQADKITAKIELNLNRPIRIDLTPEFNHEFNPKL